MRHLAAALLLLWSTPIWAQDAPRFRPVDVIVDPAGQQLAAYQIEIVIRGNAQIIGVEGGEHPAFAAAPYYDPAALNQGRIVIAAFSTASDVPRTRARIATLHVRESKPTDIGFEAKLITAADSAGAQITPTVQLRPRQGDPQ